MYYGYGIQTREHTGQRYVYRNIYLFGRDANVGTVVRLDSIPDALWTVDARDTDAGCLRLTRLVVDAGVKHG